MQGIAGLEMVEEFFRNGVRPYGSGSPFSTELGVSEPRSR